MTKYYINNNMQANGDYEVHAQGCRYFPWLNNEYLGEFYSCAAAVTEAKRKFPYRKINGCYYCSEECHTS